MSDIVERLRALYSTHPMVMEAAAEVERLRAGWKREADKDCKWALQKIERLEAYQKAADAYLMCLNDHLHGENLRCDLLALRAEWDKARRALEGK